MLKGKSRFRGNAKELWFFFFSLGPFLPFLEHQEVMSWSCPKCCWILFTSFRNGTTAVEAVATDHCTEFCLLVWELALCYFILAEETVSVPLPRVCTFPNSLWNERSAEAMRVCSTRALSSHFCHSGAQLADSSCSFWAQGSHFPFTNGVQKASSPSERNHNFCCREKNRLSIAVWK